MNANSATKTINKDTNRENIRSTNRNGRKKMIDIETNDLYAYYANRKRLQTHRKQMMFVGDVS